MSTGKTIARTEKLAVGCFLTCFGAASAGCTATYFLDTFSTRALSSGFRFFDERATDSYSLIAENGWLRISAAERQDLWDGGAKAGAPIMLRPAPHNDYNVETYVSAAPLGHPSQPMNTQIGLFVFQSEDDWLFFGLTNHDFSTSYTQNGLMVTATAGGASSIVSGIDFTQDRVFLRISRKGDTWTFYWRSNHDDDWTLLTTETLSLKDHEVGMGIKTFDVDPPSAANSGNAQFDFFRIQTVTTVKVKETE